MTMKNKKTMPLHNPIYKKICYNCGEEMMTYIEKCQSTLCQRDHENIDKKNDRKGSRITPIEHT